MGLALFTLYRMPQRAPVAEEEKASFVFLPRMCPVAHELDPHAEPDELELDLEMPEAPQSNSNESVWARQPHRLLVGLALMPESG